MPQLEDHSTPDGGDRFAEVGLARRDGEHAGRGCDDLTLKALAGRLGAHCAARALGIGTVTVDRRHNGGAP
jgi:hypothetical protein